MKESRRASDLPSFREEFVRARGIRRPDSRPLCAYQTTGEEFRQLGLLIRELTADGDIRAGFDALFCLYAAEWWRRHHEGGPWKWEGVLGSIGLDFANPQRIYRSVENGLRYWNRELIRGGSARRMFLVTLACEGGLPLRMIRSNSNRLGQYFRELLDQFDAYRAVGFGPARLAEAAGHRLPASFRQPVVYEVSGQLVDVVWQRRAQVKGLSDPVAHLDETDAAWRDALPMALDDEVAESLLRGLVVDAAKQASGSRTGFRLVRELMRLASGSWRLVGALELPGAVDAGVLGAELATNGDGPPGRCELFVADAMGRSRFLALATRRRAASSDEYLVERARRGGQAEQYGEAAAGAVRIEVKSSRGVSDLRLLRSESLSDLPWVFADRQGDGSRFRLIGEGSLRTRYDRVAVAVPAGAEVRMMEAGPCEAAGHVEEIGREVFIVGGAAGIGMDGERCVVRTAQEKDEAVRYQLQGSVFSTATPDAAPVYQGWPRLRRYSASGMSEEIRWADTQVRAVGKGEAWAEWLPDRYGLFDVRHVVASVLEYRGRVAVVPQTATLSCRPRPGDREAETLLKGLDGAEIGLPGEQDAHVERFPDRIRLVSNARRASSLAVLLRFPFGGGDLRLDLPVATSHGRFVRSDGTGMPSHGSIGVDELSAIRAIATAAHGGTTFDVVGSLEAEDLPLDTLGSNALAERTREVDGVHELPLAFLQEPIRLLLESSSDLQAEVRLRIACNGVESAPHVRVRRFGCRIDWDESGSLACVRETGEPESSSELNAEARPLWRPESESRVLARLTEGGWSLPRDLEQGPWLVSVRHGDLCVAQPRVWLPPSPGTEVAEDRVAALPNLEEAICLRESSLRREALDRVLAGLSCQPDHEDWELVRNTFLNHQDVPPSAVDLLTAVARSPRAAATALMQAGDEEFEAIWLAVDQLPHPWWSVPVDVWVDVSRGLHRQYVAEYGEELASWAFDVFERRATDHGDYMKVVLAVVQAAALGRGDAATAAHCSPEARATIFRERNRAWQELLHRRRDDHWPQAAVVNAWQDDRVAGLSAAQRAAWPQAQDVAGFRRAVCCAPAVAALNSVLGLPTSQSLVLGLRSLRAFDSDWFETALWTTMALAIPWQEYSS